MLVRSEHRLGKSASLSAKGIRGERQIMRFLSWFADFSTKAQYSRA